MWPNESAQYRDKRDQLLKAEASLRRQIEEVATLRRALPPGGIIRTEYRFAGLESDKPLSISDLFSEGKDTLILYNLMYKQDDAAPCVMCASLLDALNGAAPHITDRVNLAVIAKASASKIAGLVKQKAWTNLRFLSSADNAYNCDYGGEDKEGNQWPMLHVWRKTKDGIRHFWGSELFGYKGAPDWQNHARHVDSIWPLWNMLDLTPEGRGEDWYPKNAY